MTPTHTALACPAIELRGPPLERGRTHGAAARDLIVGMVEEHFAFLEYAARHVAGFELDRERFCA